VLHGTAEAMAENVDGLALLMTLEMGKPVAESRSEVLYAAEFLSWFAEEAVRSSGGWRPAPDGASRLLTMRRPVGPCLLVTPWNFPLAMGTRKLGPALAAGCTTIVKPAQQTPLSMLALAELFRASGAPAGVVNVLPTSDARGVVGALLADGRVRKLSFTGSTEVGRQLIGQAAEHIARTSMELGGNAPFIVFQDADLPRALDGAVLAKLRNNGEACTAANRFYVHESLVADFADGLAERFAALRVGPGSEPGVDVGPLIDEAAVAKCRVLVDDAVSRGARLLTGGGTRPGPGTWFEPTVLADVPPDARIMAEEVFGPVAAIAAFGTEDEVLARANDTPYGLAAYLYTADLERALRVAERLEVGMLGINRGVLSNPAAPFGGIGASGFGREGGDEGIAEYLDVRYIAIDAPWAR
jgi:succinate-semialdehyde dehydrogenase/glutarate-semialdehyde dehydrogenase